MIHVNKYFSGGKMMPPLTNQVQRVNVDFGIKTLQALDELATELNINGTNLRKSAVIASECEAIQSEIYQPGLLRRVSPSSQ